MLSLVKESSQNALERFFPKIKEAVHMSRQAFSLARQKVKRSLSPLGRPPAGIIAPLSLLLLDAVRKG
jgi:hypothetical protein